MVHTTDDGSIHTDIEYVEGTYSNCTEHGYSGGLYCNECEEFISGHEELPLDEGYHTDDDFDGFKEVITNSGNSSYKYLQNIYSNHDETNQAVSLALALSEKSRACSGVR